MDDECPQLVDSLYLLEKGRIKKAKDLLEWNTFFSSDERIVARTKLENNVIVSSVFLGIDHRFSLTSNKKPILFETMIFGGEYNGRMWRYTSIKETRRNHAKIVRELRKGELKEE